MAAGLVRLRRFGYVGGSRCMMKLAPPKPSSTDAQATATMANANDAFDLTCKRDTGPTPPR